MPLPRKILQDRVFQGRKEGSHRNICKRLILLTRDNKESRSKCCREADRSYKTMTLKTSTYEHSVYANVGKERILE